MCRSFQRNCFVYTSGTPAKLIATDKVRFRVSLRVGISTGKLVGLPDV